MDDWDIQARLVSDLGVPQGKVTVISQLSGWPEVHPDVAYSATSDKFLVVWEQLNSESSHHVRGASVAADTWLNTVTPLSPFTIFWDEARQTRPRVNWADGSNMFVVVCPVSSETGLDLKVRGVQPEGSLGATSMVCDAPGDQDAPDIACAGSSCLVVWEDNGDRRLNHIRGQLYRPETPLRVRVTGMTWSSDSTEVDVDWEANRTVQRYYYRLYQTSPYYVSTGRTSASFAGQGEGYYLVLITAKDTQGTLAPRPCRVWFYNKPVGQEYQVIIRAYAVADDSVMLKLGANRSTPTYYARLLPVESVYTPYRTEVVSYSGLPDRTYAIVVTGKQAGTGSFPPGGPARQFFYIDTVGF
jgi:hypothetical protein